MSDVARMPVKIWLQPDVYKALFKAATKRGFSDVGSYMAACVDRATATKTVEPLESTRKSWTRVTPEMSIVIARMYRAGFNAAEIAVEVGVTRSTVYNHVKAQR